VLLLNVRVYVCVAQDGIRVLVSRDLDLSMSLYLQFNLRFGCHDVETDFPVGHSVLVQFSNNGGILWQFLQELHSPDTAESKLVYTV